MSAKFQKPHLLGLTAAAILCLLFSNPVVAGGNPSDEAEAYASQQDNIVKGTVLDERGETLVGVSVIIQGTSIGTATDSKGRFEIKAKKGDVLLISSNWCAGAGARGSAYRRLNRVCRGIQSANGSRTSKSRTPGRLRTRRR